MKKINYYLGALALASLSLGACSSDKLAGEEPNGPDTNVERTLYVNIAIHGEGAGSRAGATDNGNPVDGTDFEVGNTAESTVSSCYLVFYDNNGNVVGQIVQASNKFTTGTYDNTVESRLEEVIPVTLQQGQDDPTQVMCYINPANPADLQNPLSTIQTIQRDKVTNDGTSAGSKLFPMSNSVYYDNTSANAPVIASQIPAKSLFATKAEAEAELKKTNSEHVIDIYVERYAAKITMNDPANTVENYITATTGDGAPGTDKATETTVTLKFNPLGWGLNGESKYTYAVKSFRQASTAGQILPNNYSYSMLNDRINANTFTYDQASGEITTSGILTEPWNWNNADYHRSYWACSPVYFQAEYPEVLSDYDAENSNQNFISFNDVTGNNWGYGLENSQYVKETTSGIPALRSKNPNAAVPTVLLAGKYTVTVGKTELPENATFYTYVKGSNDKPTVYFKTKANNNTEALSEIDGTVSMQKRFLWQTTVLYKKVGNDFVRMSAEIGTDLTEMAKATTVTRPNETVLGAVKFPSRAQTLQLTGESLNGLYINEAGTPKQIVNAQTAGEGQITLDAANKILWQNVGSCNLYTEGAAAFTIPVKHYGWYRGGNVQKNSTTIDMAKANVGDFGIVRNHTYTINVTKIAGLAPGVAGLDNPIIPPADTKDVYMAYRVNILKWAVVPTQGVEL